MSLPKAEQLKMIVSEGGVRLDKFLVEQMPDFSRARLQALIREGRVHVDGGMVTKTGTKLEGGETVQVSVPPPTPSGLIPENIPIDIIFESSDAIVVNKAAGMVVHPSAGHHSGTLMHAVLAHAPDIEGVGGELRPGLVHRLDKDTSGLIILAKNDKTHRYFQKQFKDREVEKTYLALLDGHPPTNTGRVEARIGRDSGDRKKMAVVPESRGREAVSEYRVIESFVKHSLVEIDLLTGRTHQIRVHMAFLGTPIVGDMVYGRRKPSLEAQRQFLHAAKLGIKLPGERVLRRFEATLPSDLQQVLEELR